MADEGVRLAPGESGRGDVGSVELTAQERIDLDWVRRISDTGSRIWGPSVRRFGPLPEMDRMLRLGLVTLSLAERRGYAITEAGRAVLGAPRHG
mgnify:CR=1 FL=1